MGFPLIPNYTFHNVTEITPGFLSGLGVSFLMLDLDNALAAYTEHDPAADVLEWLKDIRQHGISVFMISNSLKIKRVRHFAEAFDMQFINNAKKPSKRGLLFAMEKLGFSKKQSAMVGDQIFTDALAAKNAGVISIILRPRHISDPFLAIRYAMEIPFRRACRNKI
jgi:HAD superfamily phosphatase (TIGR01668 family)